MEVAARVCQQCQRPLVPVGRQRIVPRRKRFCSGRCRRGWFGRGSPALSTVRGVSAGIGELLVAVDLMRRGYAVFRSMGAPCPCAMVALGPGDEALRIETRVGRMNARGALVWAEVRGRVDHVAVVGPGVVTYVPPLRERDGER